MTSRADRFSRSLTELADTATSLASQLDTLGPDEVAAIARIGIHTQERGPALRALGVAGLAAARARSLAHRHLMVARAFVARLARLAIQWIRTARERLRAARVRAPGAAGLAYLEAVRRALRLRTPRTSAALRDLLAAQPLLPAARAVGGLVLDDPVFGDRPLDVALDAAMANVQTLVEARKRCVSQASQLRARLRTEVTAICRLWETRPSGSAVRPLVTDGCVPRPPKARRMSAAPANVSPPSPPQLCADACPAELSAEGV